MRLFAIASVLCFLVFAKSAVAQEKITLKTKLTVESYQSVLAALQRLPVETYWKEIEWRPNFTDAIDEARSADKPILLWVMNGHPCGMT